MKRSRDGDEQTPTAKDDDDEANRSLLDFLYAGDATQTPPPAKGAEARRPDKRTPVPEAIAFAAAASLENCWNELAPEDARGAASPPRPFPAARTPRGAQGGAAAAPHGQRRAGVARQLHGGAPARPAPGAREGHRAAPAPETTGRAARTPRAQVPTPEKKSSTPATAAPSPPEEEERPLRPTERAAAARAERERKDAAKKHRW